ncbi:MAG TPA: hypothetical protein VN577_24190 [Terriglobales bacterium]|nr:hypothetical protein [Terriglobales bacterium]
MQAEISVELGADDPTLAVPWSHPESQYSYIDLRRFPEQLESVAEAREFSELKEFLQALNASNSALQTAKCDAWFSEEITEEEAIFGASCKFGSYVDAFFQVLTPRYSFPLHEAFGSRLVELLKRAPEIQASFEGIIRRGHFENGGDVKEGFYYTLYVFGYGDEQVEARQSWGIALRLLSNALLQISSI